MEQYLVGRTKLLKKRLMDPFDFLVHYNEMKDLLELFQVTHTLEPNTLVLHIKFENQTLVLYPLFDNLWKNERYYSCELHEGSFEFAGWRPYKFGEAKHLADKLNFKERLFQNGILTPNYSVDPNTTLTDIIVKRSKGSFGQNIYGPFHSSNEYKLDLGKGEFYEQFTEGALVKIWFWSQYPTAIILRDMCYVVGDGKKTIGDYVEVVPCQFQGYPRDKYIQSTLDYFKRNLSTVLQKGERQLIDFRWISSKAWSHTIPPTLFSDNEKRAFTVELHRLGNILWKLISREVENDLAYTVDAILTKDRKLSFLEMNPNPSVHPFTYRVMCDELLANLVIKKRKAKEKWEAGVFSSGALRR